MNYFKKLANEDPILQAYLLLKYGLFLVVFIEGFDKFFNILVNWQQYLPLFVINHSPVAPEVIILILGITEVILGFVVLFKTRIGAYLLALLFLGIIINLLLIPGYYNIVIVDFGLLCASLALARISEDI